uniref:Cation/H+ exchanger transmembrane domain-containing protein n=1 Tax=Clytia hemisphaerica TaxID=252671 RepID=A0A7M5UXU9_9CNID
MEKRSRIVVNLLCYAAIWGIVYCAPKPTKQTIVNNVCNKLKINSIFRRKTLIEGKLNHQLQNVINNKELDHVEKTHRVRIINIVHREINDSVALLYGAVHSLGSLLRGEHKTLHTLKEISKKRLEHLQTSMLSVEEDYRVLLEEEQNSEKHKAQQQAAGSKNVVKKFFNDLIGDISEAADKLETDLDDDAFEMEIHSKKHKKFDVETVVKVTGEQTSGGEETNEGVVMLIDADSNHFVLSKPKDTTTTHIDHNLLKEIIFLTTLSFLFVIIGNLLNMPSNFACVVAGVMLGPSGGNYIKNIVQIETIGEFGVFFMLFSVGLEFSLDKLKKVLRESLTGVIGIFTILVVMGLFWGSMLGFLPRQSIFVTLCLAFSSTPLITKLLQGHTATRDASSDGFVNLLLAMLVIEDALLGILMATLPLIAGHSSSKSHSLAHVPLGSLHNRIHGAFGGPGEALFFTLFELCVGLTGIFLIAYVLSKYVAARFFRSLNFSGSRESFVLGIMSAVFFMLLITEYFGVSMELGCFISGTIFSTMGEQTTKKVSQTVEPFRDFFASLFFASIGFHVFPTFVISELAIFIPITTMVILAKLFVASGVLHFVLPKEDNTKWVIAAGLAQMSEFSFLLASRARRFGLIGREVFLIILSVTTLSLFFSPFLWKMTHSNFRKHLRLVVQRFVNR